jgi:hypothetical protein
MKAIRCSLVFAAAGLLFTGCSAVTVKKPAGDKTANLDPKVWEGIWRGTENFRGASTIKDPAKGLIEFRSLDPKEAKDHVTLIIRELGDRLVATAVGKSNEENSAFFRIAVTQDHVAAFSPRLDFFKEAVASGKIAGEVRKSGGNGDKNRNFGPQELVILDQFGASEVNKLFPEGQRNAAVCFDADPDFVLVREKAPAKSQAETKKRKN